MKRAVVAIIKDDKGNVLMGKRQDSGKYSLPAGGIEDGEHPRDAIKREIREETGLDMTSCKLVKIHMDKNVLVYLYECEVTGVIDHTKDPDAEFCEKPEYKNIIEMHKELHIPAKHNVALKYLA